MGTAVCVLSLLLAPNVLGETRGQPAVVPGAQSEASIGGAAVTDPSNFPEPPPTPAIETLGPASPPAAPELARPPEASEPALSPAASGPAPSSSVWVIPQPEAEPSAVPRRPRFGVSVGMGVSRDASGLVGGRTVAIPAFQVEVGVGDGLLGFEARLFSNQAAGRYHQRSVTTTGAVGPSDMPVDRQAIDVMLAFRPFTLTGPDATRWVNRVGRAVTANLGVALETASVGPPSVIRIGPIVGLHFDLPLTSGPDSGDLRIRIDARRMFAGQGQAGTVTVSDTQLEAFGGLALVF